MWKGLLVLGLGLGIWACSEPTSARTDPQMYVTFTPKHNAVACPAGTNGVAELYLHGQAFGPNNDPFNNRLDYEFYTGWRPSDTKQFREVYAEIYSYTDAGQLCRNTTKLVTWTIASALAGWTDPYFQAKLVADGPIKIELQRNSTESRGFQNLPTTYPLVWVTGIDNIIGSAGPKQICCPIQTVGGVWTDSIVSYMSLAQ